MFNQIITIIAIYYIIFIIHVFQYRYYYDLFFNIYQSKLASFLLNHSYTTITLLEAITRLQKTNLQSHASKLLNFHGFPELLQHCGTAAKNSDDFYYVSKPKQGYDALSFNPKNLQKIETETNVDILRDLLTLHENKTIKSPDPDLIVGRLFRYWDKYSHPNITSFDGVGARPWSVDQLHISMYSTENYNIVVENPYLSTCTKPSIILEDCSSIYAKIVFHDKHSGLGHGTILNDFAFEELKWFFDYLEKNEEMCSYLNYLFENNSNFPL